MLCWCITEGAAVHGGAQPQGCVSSRAVPELDKPHAALRCALAEWGPAAFQPQASWLPALVRLSPWSPGLADLKTGECRGSKQWGDSQLSSGETSF